MRLYLIEKPRTFIITSNTHALIIRHPSPDYKHKSLKGLIPGYKQKENNNNKNKVIVEFVLKEFLDLNQYRDITPRRLRGCLGLLSIKNKIFLGFITRQELTALPTINEEVFKITGTEFFCINNDEYDYLLDKDIEEMSHQDREKLSPAGSIRKLLSTGAFFYSKQFDVTSNLQERGIENESHFELFADSPYFSRFMWNGFMLGELVEFRNRLSKSEQKLMDESGFCVIIARGYAKSVNVDVNGNDGLLTLISKQSCAKEGPLFGDWGCDGNGCVSNYLESEVILYTKKLCLSYIILRGNVPMYWEMDHNFSTKSVLTSSGKKIVFPRSFEASQDAFTRHMDRLCTQFGDVHILNALSDKSYKGVLSASFQEQLKVFLEKSDSEFKILYTHIPIASSRLKKIGYSSQNPYDLVSQISESIVNFGGLFIENSIFIGKQLGVFRINSFDSLSKANFLSKVISQEVLELAFKELGVELNRDLFVNHAKLWQENDSYISKLTLNFISNSDKLQSSKNSTHHSVKNHITKKYLSSVVESKPNEVALMKLLGRLQDQTPINFHNPLHDYVSKELSKHSKEFISQMDISLFASTFNVNGTVYEGDIDNWIYPEPNKDFDLVFIGLQEIVDLNAGQMVNTDTRNKTQWERKILHVLQKRDKYMVMWSGQLGGLALFFYVKESKVKDVSNVECSFKKTGFGGVSANKGGLAVSFQYSDTSMCFVSSHFAAGLSNVEERHHNYKTLIKGIQFSKNKRVQNHDVVVWLGDFNYRIDLSNEQVKSLVLQKKYNNLFEFDQLNSQMANGESFPFFAEQEIQFPPTYKFDNGTKVYDSTEKQRIPAWTDRILYLSRKNLVKPISYKCAENLTFSDHRPVYGTFIITVNFVNQKIKKSLSNDIYENYKKFHGGINDILSLSKHVETNDESESLPAPSSDKQKWWLEGGKPAKVSIPNLNDGGMVVNPWKPINPFEKTSEPEFVNRKEIDVLY